MVVTAIAAVIAVVAVLGAVFVTISAREKAAERIGELEAERDEMLAAGKAAKAEFANLEAELSAAGSALNQMEQELEKEKLASTQATDRALNAAMVLEDWSDALLAVERLRRHREWGILAGPSLSPPLPYPDTSGPLSELLSSLAIELEAIREEVGTATYMQNPPVPTRSMEPYLAVISLRAATELLRQLSPNCEELILDFRTQAETEVFELEVLTIGVRSGYDAKSTFEVVLRPLHGTGIAFVVEGQDDAKVRCTLSIPSVA